jgi:hypothetical protein
MNFIKEGRIFLVSFLVVVAVVVAKLFCFLGRVLVAFDARVQVLISALLLLSMGFLARACAMRRLLLFSRDKNMWFDMFRMFLCCVAYFPSWCEFYENMLCVW